MFEKLARVNVQWLKKTSCKPTKIVILTNHGEENLVDKKISIYFHLPKLLSNAQATIQKDVEDGGVLWVWKPLISKPGPPNLAFDQRYTSATWETHLFSLHHSMPSFHCDHEDGIEIIHGVSGFSLSATMGWTSRQDSEWEPVKTVERSSS